MGFFSKEITCPSCSFPGAVKTWFSLKCMNPMCQYYKAGFQTSTATTPQNLSAFSRRTSLSAPEWNASYRVQDEVTFEYVNFRNERKTFRADKATLRKRGKFISIVVAPQAKRLSFRQDKMGKFF